MKLNFLHCSRFKRHQKLSHQATVYLGCIVHGKNSSPVFPSHGLGLDLDQYTF